MKWTMKQDYNKWLKVISEAVSGYMEDSIASPDYAKDRDEIEEAWELMRGAIRNPKYKIIQNFVYGWDDTCAGEDGRPLRFDSIDMAMRDI